MVVTLSVETERLEVRIPLPLLRSLKEEAHRRKIPVAELVREAVRQLLDVDRETRARAADTLFRIEAPVDDWEAMKREITMAHLSTGG